MKYIIVNIIQIQIFIYKINYNMILLIHQILKLLELFENYELIYIFV